MNMKNRSLRHQMPTSFKKTQSGLAIVIALLFLLVVTILGVSSLRLNVVNEKMTRNILLRQQAFEAAEVALIRGEADVIAYGDLIATKIAVAFDTEPGDRLLAENCQIQFGVGGGICAPVEYYQNYLTEKPYNHWVSKSGDARDRLDVWNTDARHKSVSDTEKNRLGLDENPKYIIEFLGFVPPQGVASLCQPVGALNITGAVAEYPFCSNDKKSFRVTALGVAGNKNEAQVMLQSVYVID